MIIAASVVVLGVLLVISPHLLHEGPLTAAAEVSRVIGSMIIAFGTVALWRVLSGALWFTVALAVALLIAPMWSIDSQPSDQVVYVITGLLVLALSLIGTLGRQLQGFGGGWATLWREDELWSKISWN
jgi:hypothetical protein